MNNLEISLDEYTEQFFEWMTSAREEFPRAGKGIVPEKVRFYFGQTTEEVRDLLRRVGMEPLGRYRFRSGGVTSSFISKVPPIIGVYRNVLRHNPHENAHVLHPSAAIKIEQIGDNGRASADFRDVVYGILTDVVEKQIPTVYSIPKSGKEFAASNIKN